MTEFTEELHLYRQALDFAYRAHQGHAKKTDQRPFFVHPVQVAIILLQAGADNLLVIAGILHDTCEDGGQTLDTISSRFGPEIARLVASTTDNRSLPWRERKAVDLERFRRADNRIRLLRAADALANLSILLEKLSRPGSEMAPRPVQYDEKIWYYDQIAEALDQLWPDCPLLQSIRSLLADLKSKTE